MSKICTSLEQSEKLMELGIDVSTADMYYEVKKFGNAVSYNTTPKVKTVIVDKRQKYGLSAWSLNALLGIIPYPSLHETFSGWRCDSYDNEGRTCRLGDVFDNPIDTCVEMIIRLKEQKFL